MNRKGQRAERVSYSFEKTEVGEVIVASTERGVCVLEFVCGGREDAIRSLKRRFAAAELVEQGELIHREAMDYISGVNCECPLLDLRGTEFQRRVWMKLSEIPYGKTVTYKEIAMGVNMVTAVRAVANAVGANPVAILVPCHRVVRSDGGFGGYKWGLERKIRLLEKEGIMVKL